MPRRSARSRRGGYWQNAATDSILPRFFTGGQPGGMATGVNSTIAAVRRRSRRARPAGGGTCYERVYDAERPELFFKATDCRVVGPGRRSALRSDAKWSVPEPELALFDQCRAGHHVGYTIGNDMSPSDIEAENPLYLPQAKIYRRQLCPLALLFCFSEQLPQYDIHWLGISRVKARLCLCGSTTLAELKREPKELAGFLFRDNSFPHGVFLP